MVSVRSEALSPKFGVVGSAIGADECEENKIHVEEKIVIEPILPKYC